MAYLKSAEEKPDLVTLNPDNSRFYIGFDKYRPRGPTCPVDPIEMPIHDPRFIHEKIIDELYDRRPLSKDKLMIRFHDLGDVLNKIIDREVRMGTIRMYEENGKIMYKLTKKGREFWSFTKGLESFKDGWKKYSF
jgi:predicted transcriptional regulator